MQDVLGNPFLKSMNRLKLSFKLAWEKYSYALYPVALTAGLETLACLKGETLFSSYQPGLATAVGACLLYIRHCQAKCDSKRIARCNDIRKQIDNMNVSSKGNQNDELENYENLDENVYEEEI